MILDVPVHPSPQSALDHPPQNFFSRKHWHVRLLLDFLQVFGQEFWQFFLQIKERLAELSTWLLLQCRSHKVTQTTRIHGRSW